MCHASRNELLARHKYLYGIHDAREILDVGQCKAIHSSLEDIQIILIGKHARRQGVPLLSCAH